MEIKFVKSRPKAEVLIRFVKETEKGIKGRTMKVPVRAGVPKGIALRWAAANAYKNVKAIGIRSIYVKKPPHMEPFKWYLQMYEGFRLAAYRYDRLRSQTQEDDLVVYWQGEKNDLVKKADILVEATYFTRDIVNTPANLATPEYLKNLAEDLAKKNGYDIRIFNRKELEKMGMNAFLAVAQGSEKEPYLVHLIYRPMDRKPRRRIVLVGKALTFDSGGLSLKSSQGMMTMKMDKAGAAAVLGVFQALKSLNVDYEVHGIFAATENMPDAKAVHPGDVVKSYSGKYIEILNTDAEGRLTLADALAYAAEQKPDYLIDLATLTGSAIVALGEFTAALFATDTSLGQAIVKAGNIAGERFWQMPLDDPFIKDKMKSTVADLKNISGDNWGGSIFAAQFLREFLPEKIRWVHLDIAGPAFNNKDWAYNPAGGSGFGVRTLLHLLMRTRRKR
ncbi:MAG: leucyl aminopeptidase [Thermotogae bacterium]|nr:leucyl aminopeptidase [Thermotogota bacterium]